MLPSLSRCFPHESNPKLHWRIANVFRFRLALHFHLNLSKPRQKYPCTSVQKKKKAESPPGQPIWQDSSPRFVGEVDEIGHPSPGSPLGGPTPKLWVPSEASTPQSWPCPAYEGKVASGCIGNTVQGESHPGG